MPGQVFQRRQIGENLGRFGIVKLIAAQPAPLKPVPEQDGVHLPGKLMDAAGAVPLMCRQANSSSEKYDAMLPNAEVTQRKSNATIRAENDWLVS